jgi:hypothetical protein
LTRGLITERLFSLVFMYFIYRLDPLKEVMDPDGRVDPAKLEDWITRARLDPNDPENEELLTR